MAASRRRRPSGCGPSRSRARHRAGRAAQQPRRPRRPVSPSLVLPSRPTVVGEPSSELSTASSAASTTASNNGSRPRPATGGPASGVPSRSTRAGRSTRPGRSRRCRGGRSTRSGPGPSPTRRASRAQPAASTGASVTTTPMHDPAGGAGRCVRRAGSSRPDRHPGDGEPVPLAEVGQQQHARRCARSPVTRDAVPMPPLKPRQDIPVPAPTAPSSGGEVGAARPARPASTPRATSRGVDLHPPAVVEEGVVALADDRDHDVVGRRSACCSSASSQAAS